MRGEGPCAGRRVEAGQGPPLFTVTYDRRRDAWFEARGYRVLRFWNLDVLTNSNGVGEKVCRTIQALRA